MKIHRLLPSILSVALATVVAGPTLAQPILERTGNSQQCAGKEEKEMTAEEIAHLDIAEVRARWQDHKDRLEHGEKLKKKEKERLQREFDLLEKRIHDEEHKR